MVRIVLQIDILAVFYCAGELNNDPVDERILMLMHMIIPQHPCYQVCLRLDFTRTQA